MLNHVYMIGMVHVFWIIVNKILKFLRSFSRDREFVDILCMIIYDNILILF